MAQQRTATAKNNASSNRSSAKKGSTTKRSNGKKKTNSKKKKKNVTLFDIVAQRSFAYILMLVLGVLLLLLTFVNGGFMTLWNKMRSLYFGVFGLSALLLPFFCLFRAVMGITGRDKFVYRNKSIILFVLAVLVSSVVFVSSEADADVSFADSLRACTASLWEGSNEFLVTATGLLATLIGGMFFALGQNAFLANLLLFVLIIVFVMVLFRLTPQKIYKKLEDPIAQLTYIIRNRRDENEQMKRDEEQERAEREKAKQSRRDELPEHPVRQRPRAERKPVEKAQPEEKSVKRHVTAASTKALLEELENEPQTAAASQREVASAAEQAPKQVAFEPLPDLFHVADHEIADIFTIKPVEKEVPVQAESVPIPEPVIPEKTAEKTEKEEPVKPLSEAEKKETAQELDAAMEAEAAVEKVYVLPPVEMLTPPKQQGNVNNEMELQANGEKLIKALASFNVSASILDVVPGPSVTRYELTPAPGVKISRFVGLADDLALHLAAPSGLRIEAPIPNKSAIGIEVPNKARRTVTFREVIDTKEYRKSKSKLNVGLGKDIAGNIICSDLAKMPHILVAGTTGSGKSVCMNTMICSLLYNATPDEVKLLLIDPKQVEFSVYNGIPHLLVPVVSDPRKAAGALGWAVTEMLSRYKTLNANGVRDIGAYNQLCDEVDGLQKMPQIVIFIDELSDLMTVAPSEVEDSIQRLAQMARAAGMHLVIATQRPSVDVITGVIKANIPSRIALSVSSQVDSRTIIDSAGAEKLMGYGDMLYYPVGVPKPMRVQGAFLSDEDIENVVDYLKTQATTVYNDEVEQEIERQAVQDKKKASAQISGGGDSADAAYEELVQKAIELFVNTPEKASTSSLQRHLRLGYSKAGSLMDVLEERGIVGPIEGSKPRKVLITKAQWYEMQATQGDAAQEVPTEEVPFEPDNGGE